MNGFEPCTLDELSGNNRAWKAIHGAASMALAPADLGALTAALEKPMATEFRELLEDEPHWVGEER